MGAFFPSSNPLSFLFITLHNKIKAVYLPIFFFPYFLFQKTKKKNQKKLNKCTERIKRRLGGKWGGRVLGLDGLYKIVKKIWGGEKSLLRTKLITIIYRVCLEGLHTYISKNDVYHSIVINFLF